MNVIGIDPSLVSTALIVNGRMFNYCREDSASNKSGLSKWYKLCEELVTYRFINYRSYDNYSDGELIKLKDYDKITDMIVEDIRKNIDKDSESCVGIEGYSFSSSAGDIIDLVTFSTLLRKKIFDKITQNIIVISPKSLKMESCKLTYKPIDIGKKKPKLEWRNNLGISAGNFTKKEIFMSIVENVSFKDTWSYHCKHIYDDIIMNKKIPKPYEDINDSYILYKYIECKFC